MMHRDDEHAGHPGYRYWLYNLALAVAVPFLVVWLVWRMVIQGKSREGLRERLGRVKSEVETLCSTDDPVVWFHAASVGEVAAAEPIIAQFRLKEPLAKIILSTITDTGQQRARKITGSVDAVMYFPFDIPFIVRRVFDALNPELFVMVETELWPNALAECRRRGIDVAMVNARLSGKSWSLGRRISALYEWMLETVDIICAQSEVDAERFRALGADDDRIAVTGNSKFDQDFPALSEARAAKWKQDFAFGADDRILLAGSTHHDEEDQILHVFQDLRTEYGDLQLIIAPRHPERGDAIEELIRENGYDVCRRTRVQEGLQDPAEVARSAVVSVGLLDTIGELASLYSAAGVVFVGGSLANIGGHDILQPLAQGKPVVFGPHMHKTQDITDLALRDGVVFQVANSQELLLKVHELLQDDELRERLRNRGPEFIAKYAGASEKCAVKLSGLVGRLEGDIHEPQPTR
ncbi:MAG: 3-deoxy-D-manno-octulosonic acid transferase [Armatimonadota bacterium]